MFSYGKVHCLNCESDHVQNPSTRPEFIHLGLHFNASLIASAYQVKLFARNKIDTETWFLSGDNAPLENRQIALKTIVV